MIVRCGRCGTQFDVTAPGIHSCPQCGTKNDVRAAPPAGGPVMPPNPGPPPVVEGPPSRRVPCDDCGFSFIVGDVAEAPCPNCGNPVTVPEEQGDES